MLLSKSTPESSVIANFGVMLCTSTTKNPYNLQNKIKPSHCGISEKHRSKTNFKEGIGKKPHRISRSPFFIKSMIESKKIERSKQIWGNVLYISIQSKKAKD